MKIRILHLNSEAAVGGGEKYLLTIAGKMNKERYEHIFVLPYYGVFVERLRESGYKADVIDMSSRFSPTALFKLVTYMKREKVQVTHTYGARTNFYGRIAARIAHVPIVLSTIHNSVYDYPINPLKKQIYVLLDKFTARYADRIISTAQALTDDLVNRYRIKKEKVVTIPNGIDLSLLTPTNSSKKVRSDFGIKEDAPVISIIARMTDQKGHIYLFQAVAKLVKDFAQLRCLIVGDGPLRQNLERLSQQLRIDDCCIFTGIREDLPDILAAIDILIVPSLSEGLPLIVLEAMAMERPVVASRVSGIPEVIDNGIDGILVPPRSPEALESAISNLLWDRDRIRKVGLAARKKIKDRFSHEKMISSIEAIYGGLLNKKIGKDI